MTLVKIISVKILFSFMKRWQREVREKTTSGMISNWLLSQKRAQRVVSREKLAGKVESLFLDSRRHARQRSSPIAGSGSLRQQAATIAVVSKKKKKGSIKCKKMLI
jgi:hypothetical protein